MAVLLPDVHRTTHDQHQVERLEVVDRLAVIELDGHQLATALAETGAHAPGMLDG